MSGGETSTTAMRIPLATLPLYRFVDPSSSHLFASPTSIPSKRPPPTPEGERFAKSARLVTPKVKAVLDRDELGVGKSPARRLFPEEPSVSPGVSGASPLPASPAAAPRRLAPSPPITSSPGASSSRQTSYFSITSSPFLRGRSDDLATELDLHDTGFLIHYDLHPYLPGVLTPQSRRTLSHSPLPLPSDLSTSDVESCRYENQENIPPSLSASTPSTSSRSTRYHSAKSSPASKLFSSPSAGSRSGSWYDEEEDTMIGVTGVIGVIVAESSPMTAGRKRTGKSKLAQVIAGDEDSDESGGEVGELTPGRSLREAKGKGKARLTREVEG